VRPLAWLALVVCPALTFAAGDPRAVVVFQEDRPVVLALENEEHVGRLAVEMLASATYEAGPAVAEQGWLEAQRRPRLYVTFTPPRPVRFRFSTAGPATEQDVQVTEMVVRIVGEWPDYILVREGDTVRAFSKYGRREAQALRDALRMGAPSR
jgi:hypothetical protein